MRSPCGPKPDEGRCRAHEAGDRAADRRARPQQAADRQLDAAHAAAGDVAERHRRSAAGDRQPLAVAEGGEDAAFLGGEQRRGSVDDGRVDVRRGGHRRHHVALGVESGADRDRARGTNPLGLLLLDDQRAGVGGGGRVVDREDLGEALQGPAGDDVGGADLAVGDRQIGVEVGGGELLAPALARGVGGERDQQVGRQRLEAGHVDDLHARLLGALAGLRRSSAARRGPRRSGPCSWRRRRCRPRSPARHGACTGRPC